MIKKEMFFNHLLYVWMTVFLLVFSSARGWEYQIGENHYDLSNLELSS